MQHYKVGVEEFGVTPQAIADLERSNTELSKL